MLGNPQTRMAIWQRVGFSLMIAVLFPVCLRAQNTRNVLVLFIGNADHPGNVIASAAYHEAFGSDTRNQLFEEYLDEDRLRADDKTLAETLRNKFAGKKIDLVVSGGQPALKFLLRRGEELWPGTPKVFNFVDVRELPATLPPNITGVTGTVDYGAILDLALQLRPNTRRAFYVGGVNPWEETWRALAEQDFKRFAGRVEITYLNDLPFPELLDRLGRLPDDSAVIYSELLQDASGHVYVPARVCPLIASASNAPVYGPFDTYVGCGVIGGVILDFKDMAEQTARLGLRVMERGTTSGVPVESSTKRVVVDWRQLHRWGISEKSLPSGAIVRFRSPSFWEQYKWYVLAGLAAIVAQLALIIILVIEMRRRKSSELVVKNLSGRIIHAGEEERKRIARELHDDVAQRLSLVSAEVGVLERDFARDNASAPNPLHEPLQELREVITDIHNLSHQLHSSKLQILGLGAALKDVCQQLSKQYGLQIQFIADEMPLPLQEDLALCFYRVAQEALSNSVKHSQSARVEVRLVSCDGILKMTIKDRGVGFDPSVSSTGLGLATMRERLRLVGGKLLLVSRSGEGTELTAQARLESSLQPTMPHDPPNLDLVTAESDHENAV